MTPPESERKRTTQPLRRIETARAEPRYLTLRGCLAQRLEHLDTRPVHEPLRHCAAEDAKH
jgi:hypothetical protein